MSPFGLTLAVLLSYGTWAAILVLLRRAGRNRQVSGRITAIHYYPGVRALETTLDVEQGWPGHRPGQFAFAVSDPAEGPHPYTIASAWSEQERRSEEHTSELQSLMRISYAVFCLKKKTRKNTTQTQKCTKHHTPDCQMLD